MAYQSLNIIGSFTAGVPAVQRETGSDRARIEAFRASLREQAAQQNRMATEDATTVEGDQKIIGDAPHQRRNPYLFLRYPRRDKPHETADSVPETQGGHQLDVVV